MTSRTLQWGKKTSKKKKKLLVREFKKTRRKVHT